MKLTDPVLSDPTKYAQDHVLLKYRQGWPEKSNRQSFARAHGMRETTGDPDTNWFTYMISDGSKMPAKLAELQSTGEVIAVPDEVIEAAWTPTDELYAHLSDPVGGVTKPLQWNLPKISMPRAWDVARGGVAFPKFIAVLDSGAPTGGGAELGLFKINGRWYGQNFYGSGTYPDSSPDPGYDPLAFGDCLGHGTFVASVAAASANNGGMAGIAFNTGIMPVRVLDCGGHGFTSEVARAMDWILKQNVAVAINCSFAFPPQIYKGSPVYGWVDDPGLPLLKQKVQDAWNKNVPVVASSGNDNRNTFSNLYPAAWYYVITVGATDADDKRSVWPMSDGTTKGSNYGSPGLDLAAPGSDILGMVLPAFVSHITQKHCNSGINTCFGWGDGTSFAAPQVSATISLMLQRHPGLTSAQIKEALSNSADKVRSGSPAYPYDVRYYYAPGYCNGQSQELGCGRLNVYKAVTYWD